MNIKTVTNATLSQEKQSKSGEKPTRQNFPLQRISVCVSFGWLEVYIYFSINFGRSTLTIGMGLLNFVWAFIQIFTKTFFFRK